MVVPANIYTGKTTMQHVEMSTPRESVVVSTSSYDGLVYDIATLSSSSGLFVGINQDESETADTATVFAGAFNYFYAIPLPVYFCVMLCVHMISVARVFFVCICQCTCVCMRAVVLMLLWAQGGPPLLLRAEG